MTEKSFNPQDEPASDPIPAISEPILITRLDPVDVRRTWPTEPYDFTPWLMDNTEDLSQALGIDIELDASEHKVGTFSLDLIGREVGSGRRVIVENQFGPTDHTHLGQIMTCAGGTDPAIIVWIAETFREPHRAALDWLNNNTMEGIGFFGVALSVVRMKAGPSHVVAPLFEVVSKPNDWEKAVKTSVEGGTHGTGNPAYLEFWETFAPLARERGWTKANPRTDSWWDMPTGVGGVWWSVSFSKSGCRSELYFGSSDPGVNTQRFEALLGQSEQIQAHFGDGDLVFDPLPERKGARIETRLDGPSVGDPSTWPAALAWMVETQQRLRLAVAKAGGVPGVS